MLLFRSLVWAALAAATAGQTGLSEAKRLESLGDYPRAIAVLEKYLKEEPFDLEGGTLLAWLYARTEKNALAIEAYRALVSRHPEVADLHNSLGALLFKERELAEAERELENAVALDPSLVMAHYNLGLVRFEKGELEGAARGFATAVELDPKNPHYHFSLARAYRGSYELEKAAASFRAGLALSPPSGIARPARLELALTLKHDGRFAESEAELRNLLAADAADVEALFQIGRLYLAMNRYPEAETAFRKLTEVSPDYAPARFMLGLVSYREDAPEKALASFQKLVELSPDHAEGRYYLGMCLSRLGDLPGARTAFEEALRIEPDHASATYNLGLLLGKQGERERSRELLERFRELGERRERLFALEERVRWDPANARFHFELGQEYSRQMRTAEALQAFQRALEIEPDLAAAEVAIADLMARRVR